MGAGLEDGEKGLACMEGGGEARGPGVAMANLITNRR